MGLCSAMSTHAHPFRKENIHGSTFTNGAGLGRETFRRALPKRNCKRRSDGAKKAAVTRKRRQAKLVQETAKKIVEGAKKVSGARCQNR